MKMDIGVTGHRVLKHEREELEPKVLSILQKECVSTVHTGFAWGFDLFVAWVCYSNKIPFIAHIAFPDQWSQYPSQWARLYHYLLPMAKEQIIYNDRYNKRIYFRRDEGLVDASEGLLTYYDGREKGGTYYTVKYAADRKRPMYHVIQNNMPKLR